MQFSTAMNASTFPVIVWQDEIFLSLYIFVLTICLLIGQYWSLHLIWKSAQLTDQLVIWEQITD